MTFARDFDNMAAIARERQAHILQAGSGAARRRAGRPWAFGLLLVAVCAPLAAIFFIQVW